MLYLLQEKFADFFEIVRQGSEEKRSGRKNVNLPALYKTVYHRAGILIHTGKAASEMRLFLQRKCKAEI